MIEMHRLKNVVIFIQTILSFVLSRKVRKNCFGNLYINNSFINLKILGMQLLHKMSES